MNEQTNTLPDRLIVDLQVLRLDSRAALPAYHSDLAAGLDIAACLPREPIQTDCFTIHPHEIFKVPTGIALAIPPGYEAQVRPRSGLSINHGITVPNAPGTIDADYRGEVFIALINLGTQPYEISHGLRIAQLVIAPVAHAKIIETSTLNKTARGERGFGSTGQR